MTTNTPTDELGFSLDPVRSVQRADPWAPWQKWAGRVEKRITSQQTSTQNLATAVKIILARQRAEHDAEVAELRAEVKQLRAEAAAVRQISALADRIERIESSPSRGAGLRTV